jgi:hypothetical protein
MGYFRERSGDLYSALIYYSVAVSLIYTTGSKQDSDTIAIATNLAKKIQYIRSAYARSLKNEGGEEGETYVPEDPSRMVNEITGEILDFNTLQGMISQKMDTRLKFLYPIKYPFLFNKSKNNVLFYGPPGTGKTLLAKAAIGELNRDEGYHFEFFNLSADAVKSKWEGGTEKNIEQMFSTAQRVAEEYENDHPEVKKCISVLFLDEVEAIAKARNKGGSERSVTTLLQQMDGINSKPNVSVIAATNYPWELDSAFLRRFTGQVLFDVPDFNTRVDIIKSTIIGRFIKDIALTGHLANLKVYADMTEVRDGISTFNQNFKEYTANYISAYNEQSFFGGLEISRDDYALQFGDFNTYTNSSVPSDNNGIFIMLNNYLQRHMEQMTRVIQGVLENSCDLSSDRDFQGHLKYVLIFIFYIAELTGPNIKGFGKKAFGKAKNSVGYSNSDLTNLVNEFFSTTANYIIERKFRESGEWCNSVMDPSCRCGEKFEKKYELFQEGDSFSEIDPTNTSLFFVNKDYPEDVEEYGKEVGDLYSIVNTTLFYSALQKFKPTVDIKEYPQYLKYSLGIEDRQNSTEIDVCHI